MIDDDYHHIPLEKVGTVKVKYKRSIPLEPLSYPMEGEGKSMSKSKVCIASSHPNEIGNRCKAWAVENMPYDFELTDDMDDCLVFISILYDRLITKKFIDRHRCYNFHPGILPDYRGSGVYSWVLLNQESETGVTLHEIDYNMDSGPIILVERTTIVETDTANTLFNRCMDILYNMFTDLFPMLLRGIRGMTPNKGGRLYLKRHLHEARDISHLIRAFTFEGKESAYWLDSNGKRVYVEWK